MPSTLVRVFKTAAVLEAISWGLLLIGMFFKWVTQTTEMGVKIAGPIHGVMFILYVLTTLKLWQDHDWPVKEFLIGLVCSVIPFATVWFEKHAEHRGLLRPAGTSRTLGA